MINYEPFFQTLKRKGISTYKLVNEYGFSKGTLDSLKQNRNVTIETLNTICNLLDCDISDVIKYTKDNQ
ncbi:MAG: helix-turn-helix transcriptional regulator [Bacteroidales bacterium]